MEAVGISSTSVYFMETIGRYIPQNSHVHIRRRDNLKSYPDYSSRFRDKKSVIRFVSPNTSLEMFSLYAKKELYYKS